MRLSSPKYITVTHHGITVTIKSASFLMGFDVSKRHRHEWVGKGVTIRKHTIHTVIFDQRRVDAALTMRRARQIAKDFCKRRAA